MGQFRLAVRRYHTSQLPDSLKMADTEAAPQLDAAAATAEVAEKTEDLTVSEVSEEKVEAEAASETAAAEESKEEAAESEEGAEKAAEEEAAPEAAAESEAAPEEAAPEVEAS